MRCDSFQMTHHLGVEIIYSICDGLYVEFLTPKGIHFGRGIVVVNNIGIFNRIATDC